MTRRFGLAEGLEWEDLQRVNQGMELLAPLAPDRGEIPPWVLRAWALARRCRGLDL